MRTASLLALLLTAGALPVAAQPKDPIGRFVVDLRGVVVGLPTAAGWTPSLPAAAVVPSRGFGFEGGAHAHVRKLGAATLGVGATYSWARGTVSPEPDSLPEVRTRATLFSPQLSLNFGHRLGWSYLSAGYGAVKVVGDSVALADLPAAVADSGWSGAITLGGGARWFLSDHLGVGFDARWHRLSPRDATATTPAAARATMFRLAVGVSVQ
ncbi:MAG: hypothetical protein IT179_02900 [Acidobacteria bacterium]|nr:hypothetical protein [Acidobacteriota bacterium]